MPVRFYIILEDENEKFDFKRGLVMINKFKIFYPSRIKNLFYFYLSYERFQEQSELEQQKEYFEPKTGLKGELDTEYFALMF